jgi:hypothetical protein
MISDSFKKLFGRKLYDRLKSSYLTGLTISFGNSLPMLARIYKTDKWGKHNYTKHYSSHFRRLRFKRIILFEIGAGGYDNPEIGGNSLRMWKRYFPFGKIFSLDIYDKSQFEESRIKIFKGDQTDTSLLERIIGQIGKPNIIIDDGSHINEHVVKTFELLFPLLKTGGIYVVEDTETSYWPDYGGDSENLNNPATTMNYFKRLSDCLNHQELLKRDYVPSYFDRNIYSIQFYHNIIFIFKGLNNEGSSIDWNNSDSILKDKIRR